MNSAHTFLEIAQRWNDAKTGAVVQATRINALYRRIEEEVAEMCGQRPSPGLLIQNDQDSPVCPSIRKAEVEGLALHKESRPGWAVESCWLICDGEHVVTATPSKEHTADEMSNRVSLHFPGRLEDWEALVCLLQRIDAVNIYDLFADALQGDDYD